MKNTPKNYQWKWNGRYTPLQRLHYSQLFSILTSLNAGKIHNTGNVSTTEWKAAIKQEIDRRSIQDQNQIIRMIEKNHVNRAKNTVNSLIKQFSNAKIF